MSDEHIKVLRELRHDLSHFDGSPPNPRDIAALDAAIAALGGVETVATVGECAELEWLNGGVCQLAPGTKLYTLPAPPSKEG